jgi:hypothetical protein
MQTLLLPEVESRRDQTNCRSDRDGARESREWHAPALQTLEHSVALPGTNAVLKRFNRHTEWLATGLSGAVVFAALAFAVLVPERHPQTADLPTEASQARSDHLMNADAAMPFRIVDLNAKRSTSQATSGTSTNVDHGFSLWATCTSSEFVQTKGQVLLADEAQANILE